jgi:hypothetical protein
MGKRVEILEKFAETTGERLTRIEGRLDGIEARMVTKDDLKAAMLSQLKWFIGVTLVLLTFFFASVAFLLDVSKLSAPAAAAAPTPPVVIYLPAPLSK